MTRSRRRVGFRKGADIDEELWPTESFGGVSDEQFWDDMASDKPLTTTARTAQPDDPGHPAAARRSGPSPAACSPVDDRSREGQQARHGRGRGHASAAPPRARTDRTAIQPAARPAGQPGATAPLQRTALSGRDTSHRRPPAQPVRAGQPVRAAPPVCRPAGPQADPAACGPRGRRGAAISAEEDPLTSAAFSLRASGPVDGRSSPARSRPTSSTTPRSPRRPRPSAWRTPSGGGG